MNGASDEELVEHYRAAGGSSGGDPFLDQLFQRYHSRVAAWCVRMTGDADWAADLAQDVFVKAFRHLEAYRGDSKFTTWLYSIARNRCMDELRSRAARMEDAPETGLEDVADERSPSVLTGLMRRESEEMVRGLIRESLNETERRWVEIRRASGTSTGGRTGSDAIADAGAAGLRMRFSPAWRCRTRARRRWMSGLRFTRLFLFCWGVRPSACPPGTA